MILKAFSWDQGKALSKEDKGIRKIAREMRGGVIVVQRVAAANITQFNDGKIAGETHPQFGA